jgi:predicted nucleotidyltransferase
VRAVPDSLEPSVVAQVDDRLDGVERDHGVRIAWAVESGSRAWGFPSPDSDYDARFLYVRPLEDYLSPWRPRDVIETPLDAVLDVNGWDLVKAVQLAVRGNATVSEWLSSPIVYRGDPSFRDGLAGLVAEVSDRRAVGRHYAHVGLLQWSRHGLGDDEVSLKGLLYAVRAAVAATWLLERPEAVVPPMDLPSLLAGVNLAPAVRSAVEDLVRVKAVTREVGRVAPADHLVQSVRAMLDSAESAFAPADGDGGDVDARRRRAAAGFRSLVEGFAPSSTHRTP